VSVALIALGAQAFKAGQRAQPSQGTLQQDDQPEEKICTGFLNQSATDCWNSDSLLGIHGDLYDEETQDMMVRVCDQKGVEQYQKIPQTNVYVQCGLNPDFKKNTRGSDHCYSNTCIPPKAAEAAAVALEAEVTDPAGKVAVQKAVKEAGLLAKEGEEAAEAAVQADAQAELETLAAEEADAAAPKGSVDDTTGAGAAAAASKKSWVLDILTDFGEETDDEVMVTAACLIALKDNTMQLNIMFLDKDPKAQEKKLASISRP